MPDAATRERVFRAVISAAGASDPQASPGPLDERNVKGLMKWVVLVGVAAVVVVAVYLAGHTRPDPRPPLPGVAGTRAP
jgi:hypothetical protein